MEPTEFGWASLEVALSAAPKRNFDHMARTSVWVGAVMLAAGVPLHGLLYLNRFSVMFMAMMAGLLLAASGYGLRTGISAWNHAARGLATNQRTALLGIALCSLASLAFIALVVLTAIRPAPVY